MEWNEVKQWIDTNLSGNEEAKTHLQGLFPVTVEGVQKFVTENKDAKSWFDSEKDKHHNKSLETWKTNSLNKVLDEEIKKRFPEADPKDVKMKELEAKLESMQKETLRKELTNKAFKIATEKKLPVEIIDYLVGTDEETTNQNLTTFETVFNNHVQKLVEERLKDGSHVPPKGTETKTTIEQLNQQLADAQKAGNTALVVSIKNRIFEFQK